MPLPQHHQEDPAPSSSQRSGSAPTATPVKARITSGSAVEREPPLPVASLLNHFRHTSIPLPALCQDLTWPFEVLRPLLVTVYPSTRRAESKHNCPTYASGKQGVRTFSSASSESRKEILDPRSLLFWGRVLLPPVLSNPRSCAPVRSDCYTSFLRGNLKLNTVSGGS